MKSQIEVVLLSGGSGTDSITRALIKHPQIRLRILINAYDDGHSTGRLRRFIPGMLGPSDVRKNVARLMPQHERCQRALAALSDRRLPVGISETDALATLDGLLDGYSDLTLRQARQVTRFLDCFRDYGRGHSFDFTDCAIGNLLFAGCYLDQQRDFNRAIDAFCELYEVPAGTLLNITSGENLFLIAEKENGQWLLNEADIVATHTESSKIKRLLLVQNEASREHVTPAMNPAAAEAISHADVIIYGPGTQHSSLFPSYMTAGFAERVAANKNAAKIFVGNIVRDADIQSEDINDLAVKFMQAMTRSGSVSAGWTDCVTHFFVQQPGRGGDYIPFDSAHFAFPLHTVRLLDWEAQAGRHSGGVVLDEIQRIVQERIDIQLQQVQHMVSIVTPVLNEARTLDEVLRSVAAPDLHGLGLTKEIIVVDGGSTDGSALIAQNLESIKTIVLPAGLGRGAALRAGIDKARGNIVVFFAGDNEYQIRDLYAVIESLAGSRYRAVFGTRAVKVRSLSERLARVYGEDRWLYRISKYGGMLLSVVTLLLYNRYVTDVLTSLKGFDAALLRELKLTANGRDLETELIAKLSLRQEFILEIPVDYEPRTRAQGKTITVGDGLNALFNLFRYRFISQ